MKVIIVGSRSLHDYKLIEKAVAFSGWRGKITEVVSGCAPGIDSLAIFWATNNGIKVKKMPAEWDKLDGIPPAQIRTNSVGKQYNIKAGFERNERMAQYVGKRGGLIAVWDSESRGTEHMIDTAEKAGIKVSVYEV